MPLTRRAPVVVLAIVASLFILVGLRQAWTDAPTVDEGVYVASGLTAVTRHDLRLNRQHPPLAKVLAVLPALAAHPVIPRGASWRRGREYDFTTEFVRAQVRRHKLREVFFLARLVPLVEAV